MDAINANKVKSIKTLTRLELRRVSKTYQSNGQSITALHDLSFVFQPGAVTALLGRSGCGKTTLLNMVGAMDFPTSGEVLIDGRATSSLNDSALTALRRTHIVFVSGTLDRIPETKKRRLIMPLTHDLSEPSGLRAQRDRISQASSARKSTYHQQRPRDRPRRSSRLPNATAGFQKLRKTHDIPAKSPMRMLEPKGSPSAPNLFNILSVPQKTD